MATTREKYANRAGGIEPFWPHHILHMGIVICLAVLVLMIVVFFFPWVFLGEEYPADPQNTPAHIKPEWYFLAAYQGLKLVPSEFLGVMVQGLVVTLIFLLPFWERTKPKPLRKRPVFIAVVALCVLAYIGLTIWGKFS